AGKEVSRPKDVAGSVMGVSFVPGKDVVLFGADALTAVNAADGAVVFRANVKGAQAVAFGGDGKTVLAGGWGQTAAGGDLNKDNMDKTAAYDAVVGGVALLPGGVPVVALWGGTHPLMTLPETGMKPAAFMASQFGFQNVVWSDKLRGLIAAEQGGRLWLL